MYINKPSATKIEAADRVSLLHSTSCRFEWYEFRKAGQVLVSLPRYVPKLLISNIEIKHKIDFKTALLVASGSSQCEQTTIRFKKRSVLSKEFQ